MSMCWKSRTNVLMLISVGPLFSSESKSEDEDDDDDDVDDYDDDDGHILPSPGRVSGS